MAGTTPPRRDFDFERKNSFAASIMIPLSLVVLIWKKSQNMQETTSTHPVIDVLDSGWWLRSSPNDQTIDNSEIIRRDICHILQDDMDINQATLLTGWHSQPLIFF